MFSFNEFISDAEVGEGAGAEEEQARQQELERQQQQLEEMRQRDEKEARQLQREREEGARDAKVEGAAPLEASMLADIEKMVQFVLGKGVDFRKLEARRAGQHTLRPCLRRCTPSI